MLTLCHWIIFNLSEILLGKLTVTAGKDKRKVIWTGEHNRSLEIRDKLARMSEIIPQDQGREFILTTDTSKIAIRTSISYSEGTQQYHFFQRNRERRCSTFDKELLSIYLVVKPFQHYPERVPFVIETDHKFLTYIQTMKSSIRQQRWIKFINEFTFDIRYSKRSDDMVVDFLSRPSRNDNILSLEHHLSDMMAITS